MTKTFLALLELADISEPVPIAKSSDTITDSENEQTASKPEKHGISGFSGLHYNIQIHLPATKDVEVYNAIFKSLKEHLID